MSQSFTVLSPEPEARVFPSGLHATLETLSVCPCKVDSSLPVAGSQSFTVLSLLAVARVCPSGANATEDTASVWPVSGAPIRCARTGSRTSHKITDLSVLTLSSALVLMGLQKRLHRGLPEPNAMVLSTVTDSGRPRARST